MIRKSSSATAVLGIVVLIGAGFTASPGTALAQDASAEGEQQETRRGAALSERVYRKLAEAQEAAEADNWAGALRALDEVKAMERLSPYETAQLYSFYGYVYYGQERFNDSIGAYETVLRQPELDQGLRESTTYTLAQLYFATEQWRKAADLVSEFLKTAQNPAPDPYILLGSAYYQMEDYRQLIPAIERAIEIAKQRGIEDREQWWLLLRVGYYETQNMRKVLEVLETLVTRWPKKEYWVQLSAIYGELDQSRRQLAAYEAAYDQGLLTSGLELVQLSQLFLASNVPFKAARVLEKGMEANLVEKTEANYRLLSQAWAVAREDAKSIEPLRTAAGMSRDGELDVRLAQAYLNLGRHQECIQAARAGLQKGRVGRADLAQIVLGTCLFETRQYEEAKSAFNRAAEDGRSAGAARQWIQYVDSELQRQQQLQESLRQVPRDS